MKRSEKIDFILKSLPHSPGVYQYFDKDGKIIYVGKAKSLKNRVGSYFSTSRHDSGKTNILVSKIADIKTIKVATEMDALLLENSLIKKYQPKYNIQLKDDKTYPWICIKNEPYPRVFYTRKLVKDGSEYYGPFHSVRMIKTLLELFKTTCEIRDCTHKLTEENIGDKAFQTSVEYYIGNCKGCCQGQVSKKEYDHRLRDVKKILKGNIKSVIEQLRIKMKKHSDRFEFEKAQDIKERLALIEKYQSKSAVVSAKIHNVDVYSIDQDVSHAYVNFLKVMNGAIIQSHTLEIKKKLEESDSELLRLAMIEMRERFPSKAKEIIIPVEVELELENVRIGVPQRGEKKTLVELSQRNAKYFKLEKHKQVKIKDPEKSVNRILETIKQDLRMKELPRHIECFDNSNLQGTNPVSACVVFKDAKPSKKDYRHFNIKTVVGPDDFASMEEVIYRRYKRLLDEEKDLPQLIVIDGGKGQLSSAMKSIDALGLRGQITVVGIAKRLEEIYFPGDSLPVYIDKRSESLKVIQHARNEAHRFGITHHRGKRIKSTIKSELDGIPGIGPQTQTILLKDFKSVKRIKEATKEQLEKSVGKSKAAKLMSYFNKD